MPPSRTEERGEADGAWAAMLMRWSSAASPCDLERWGAPLAARAAGGAARRPPPHMTRCPDASRAPGHRFLQNNNCLTAGGSLTRLDRSRSAVVDVLHQRRQDGRAPAGHVVPAGQGLVGAVGTDLVVVEIRRVLRGVPA